jgi:hypothetical protein
MKLIKNVSVSSVTLSNLTSPRMGLETLTLGPDEEYDISNREQDFVENEDVLVNVRNGNLQVGNGGVYYTDAYEGEVYLRSTFVSVSYLTDGTNVAAFAPAIVTDTTTGKKGTNLFMDILGMMRELYNDPGDPLYSASFQKFVGTGGREVEHIARTSILENIHAKVGWHRREIFRYGYIAPLNLLIYYGWINSFNSAQNGWDNNKVAKDLSKYSLIVFGDGVEDPGHGDYANTQAIIGKVKALNPEAKIFGYVACYQSLANFQTKVDQWNTLGVHGIFMDESGYDYGDVSTNGREAFNTKVEYVHGRSSSNIVFVNSWTMDHIIGTVNDPSFPNSTWNPDLLASALTSDDWYLLESFPVNTTAYSGDSGYESKTDWKYRGDKAIGHRNTYGINLAAVGIIADDSIAATALFQFLFVSSLMYGLEACGSSDASYGASSAKTTFRTRPNSLGLARIWSNSPNVAVDPADADVYFRFLDFGILSLDFSTGAQLSTITKNFIS